MYLFCWKLSINTPFLRAVSILLRSLRSTCFLFLCSFLSFLRFLLCFLLSLPFSRFPGRRPAPSSPLPPMLDIFPGLAPSLFERDVRAPSASDNFPASAADLHGSTDFSAPDDLPESRSSSPRPFPLPLRADDGRERLVVPGTGDLLRSPSSSFLGAILGDDRVPLRI